MTETIECVGCGLDEIEHVTMPWMRVLDVLEAAGAVCLQPAGRVYDLNEMTSLSAHRHSVESGRMGYVMSPAPGVFIVCDVTKPVLRGRLPMWRVWFREEVPVL